MQEYVDYTLAQQRNWQREQYLHRKSLKAIKDKPIRPMQNLNEKIFKRALDRNEVKTRESMKTQINGENLKLLSYICDVLRGPDFFSRLTEGPPRSTACMPPPTNALRGRSGRITGIWANASYVPGLRILWTSGNSNT